jgi:hypothetical protein
MDHVEMCDRWKVLRLRIPPVNPLTNRRIKIDGPKYKQLEKECDDKPQKPQKPQKNKAPDNSPIIDINSMCETWLEKEHPHLYEIMKDKEKNVWGSALSHLSNSNNLINNREYYSVDFRDELSTNIKNYFKNIVVVQGETCVTGNKSLLNHVSNPVLLGFGSFGNVYSAIIPITVNGSRRTAPIAVKESRLDKSTYKLALDKKYPEEYLFNKMINDIISDRQCPNFSYTFVIYFCNKCILKQFDGEKITTQCSETIVELFDLTLNKLPNTSDEVILSVMFQILFALASIQLRYGMFHNDIKKVNILLKVVPSGGYWEYNLNNVAYNVPNHGFIACLNDFGVSKVFRESVTPKYYGKRQVEVVNVSKDKWSMVPVITQAYPVDRQWRIDSKAPRYLKKSKIYTQNYFMRGFDSLPNVPVDLSDMARFPVYNFHMDILDVIFSFVGGERTTQMGSHVSMAVSTKIKEKFKNFYLVDKSTVLPADRVDMFLAHHTIRVHFPFYLKENSVDDSGSKIESYTLNF